MKTKLWLRSISWLVCLLLITQCCTFAVSAETETVATEATEEPVQIEGELIQKRTANEKYFMRSDQSILAAVYPNAVHYKDVDGTWKEIDNRLTESTDGAETVFSNTVNALNVKFAKKAKDGKLVKLHYEDTKIAWYLNGAAKTTATPLENDWPEQTDPTAVIGNQSAVLYENILPKVDLEYLLIGDELKENIVLKDRTAIGTYTFTYETGALTMTLSDNMITLWQGDKAVLFLNAPLMTDAAGNTSDAITLSLRPEKENENNHVYTVSVTPDAEWLNAARRVYPVKVDPSLTTEQTYENIMDTYVSKLAPGSNYTDEITFRVGKDASTNDVYRAFLKFDLPTDIGESDRVVNATLNLYPDPRLTHLDTLNAMASQRPVLQAHAVQETWATNEITWGNQPETDSDMLDYEIVEAKNGSEDATRWYGWNITSLVDDWYTSGVNNGVMLKLDNESGYTGNTVAKFCSSEFNLLEDDNSIVFPLVSITYLNMLGLEDYWTYHSLDAGVGGTAYVNDFTGGLTIVTPVASVDSAHTPLNVSLVYSPGSNDASINALNVGNHFMLNLQCYVKPVTIGDVQKYKYVDGDGTTHYFAQKNNKWTDESGQDLTLSMGDGYYTIRDKKDNLLRFYADTGRLCNIKDSVGNNTQLYYTVVNGKYYLSSVTNGTHTITFTRDSNNRLSRVYYPDADGTNDQRFAQITYTASKNGIYHLTQYIQQGTTLTPTHIVSFPCDHNVVSRIISCPYDADRADGAALSGTALIFGYTNEGNLSEHRRRITSYKMVPYVNGTLQSNQPEYHYAVTYHRNATRFTSQIAGDSGVFSNELYTFDALGRTRSAQDQDGYATYQEHGISGGAKNKVTFTSDTRRHVANLLKNHSFEKGDATTLTQWAKIGNSGDNAAIKGTADNEPVFVGTKAMKVYKNDAAQTVNSSVRQAITLTKGKKYTLSAYVYTDLTTLSTSGYTGAFLCVETADYSPQSYCHNIISDGAWSRHFVTIDLTGNVDMATSETFYVYLGIERAKGAVYFDGVQLEEGGSVNSYNLIENAGFEDSTDTAWIGTELQSGDGRTTDSSRVGYFYKMVGNSKTSKKLARTVTVSGKQGDGITAGAFIRNFGLPNKDTYHNGTKQDCAITLEICHSDGSSQFVTQSAENEVDHWQYVCLGAVAEENYTQLKLYLKFIYNGNTAYFDDVGLYRDTFGQSLTYDEKGNVTTVVDMANNTKNIITDGNNDMTSYTDGEGNEYTFEYDGGNSATKKHLLTKVTDPLDDQTAYTYDAKGNVTKTTLTDAAGNMTMSASTAYTADGHYVASQTDAAGMSIRYNRSTVDGRVNDVRAPLPDGYDLKTSYTYDPLTKETVGVEVATDIPYGGEHRSLPANVTYAYDRGNLTDIVRKADTTKQMGYHMTYDNVGKRTGVYWSGKTNTQSLLQSATYKDFGAVDTVTYGNGQTLSYTYNNAGLVTEKAYNNTPVVKYDYNANYALGAAAYYRPVSNTWERTNYFYDLAGRISETKDTRGLSTGAYSYDKNNRLLSYRSVLEDAHVDLGYTTRYTYLADNTLKSICLDPDGGYESGTMRYGYDGIGRLYIKRLSLDSMDNSFRIDYTYKQNEDGSRTTRPSTTSYKGIYNGTTVEGSYYSTYYDDGKIASHRVIDNNGTKTTAFEYDALGQLTSTDDGTDEYTYSYDAGGNLTAKTFTTSADDSDYTATYTYDSNFSDLLTGYAKTEDGVTTTRTYNYTASNGTKFVNPVSITETNGTTSSVMQLGWRQGRTLESITTDAGTVRYEYNENGQRILRQLVNGAKREYYYNGTQLEYIKILTAAGNLTSTMRYIYNANGQAEYILYITKGNAKTPAAYNLYYILRDNTGVIQKLIKVRAASSTSVTPTLSVAVEYKYDPYGKLLSITKASGESVGTYNPLVYKDYIWDSETDWYYCNSRYYDPETGRWINADAYLTTEQSITDTNMFLYCGNNPVLFEDASGNRYAVSASQIEDETWEERGYSCDHMNKQSGRGLNPSHREELPTGERLIYYTVGNSKVVTPKSLGKNTIIIKDVRNNSLDPGNANMQIVDSYKYTRRQNELRINILNSMLHYCQRVPNSGNGWIRSVPSMLWEWDLHNLAHDLYLKRSSSGSVDLDNKSEDWGIIQHIWYAIS